MRQYKVGKKQHTVFDEDQEVPTEIKVVKNWRNGHLGDWVRADDGCVIQILRENKVMTRGKHPVKYIGTCTGTYLCRDRDKMDTARRENIYSFSAKASNNTTKRVKDRDYLTANEAMFAKYLANGFSPEEAYMKSFGTENIKYAKMKSAVLIKQERVVSAVKEELDVVLKGLGVDLKYLIKGVKLEAENADRSGDRLRAFQMLWDAADVVPKQKVTQMTGAVFQGFSQDMLDSAKRPELKGKVENAIEPGD